MIWLYFVLLQVFLVSLAALVYYMQKPVKCPSDQDMHGKVVIITGGNSGVGFEAAKELARRRARLILACRSKERGESAVLEIIRETGWSDVRCEKLDLTSFESVRQFAENIRNSENEVHVLINNAAAVPGITNKTNLTEDGLEVQWQTNYFSHFLLTILLLPLLRNSAPSRVINVSSYLYHAGRINFDNFSQKQYKELPLQIYSNTKLAINSVTYYMAKQLAGSQISFMSCTPGTTKTNIARNQPWYIRRTVGALFAALFCRPVIDGAQVLIYLAVEPKISEGFGNGQYFVDCEIERLTKIAQDENLAQELIATSEKIVKQPVPSFRNNNQDEAALNNAF